MHTNGFFYKKESERNDRKLKRKCQCKARSTKDTKSKIKKKV